MERVVLISVAAVSNLWRIHSSARYSWPVFVGCLWGLKELLILPRTYLIAW